MSEPAHLLGGKRFQLPKAVATLSSRTTRFRDDIPRKSGKITIGTAGRSDGPLRATRSLFATGEANETNVAQRPCARGEPRARRRGGCAGNYSGRRGSDDRRRSVLRRAAEERR